MRGWGFAWRVARVQLVPTSKKPADVRRSELMAAIQAPMMGALLKHATLYARNKFGAEVSSPCERVGEGSSRVRCVCVTCNPVAN